MDSRVAACAALLIAIAACSSDGPAGIDEPIRPTAIRITPRVATLRIADEIDLSAAVLDQYGLPFPDAGDIQWKSDKPTVADVQELTGHVTAHAGGVAYVEARYGTMTRNARIDVLFPLSFEFTANVEQARPGNADRNYVCTLGLMALGRGGAPGEFATWSGGQVEIRRILGPWEQRELTGLEVSDWFGGDRLYAGEGRAGRAAFGEPWPFDVWMTLRASMPDGSTVTRGVGADCF